MSKRERVIDAEIIEETVTRSRSNDVVSRAVNVRRVQGKPPPRGGVRRPWWRVVLDAIEAGRGEEERPNIPR